MLNFRYKLGMMDNSHSTYQIRWPFSIKRNRGAAIAGMLLLVLPVLFITGVIFKHYLQMDLGIFTSVYDWILAMDRKHGNNSILNWLIRFLLLGGPFIALLINFLAVFRRRSSASFKLSYKWINLLVIISGALLCILFLSYLLAENLFPSA